MSRSTLRTSTTDSLADHWFAADGFSFDDAAGFSPQFGRREPQPDDARGKLDSTFDDLVGTLGLIPTGYHGLTWSNMAFIDRAELEARYDTAGYLNAFTSGDTIAFNAAGDPVSLSAGGTFDFISANLTSAWRDGMTVDIYGYADGKEKYHQTVTINTDGPTHFDFGFRGVDDVRFVASGGTKAPGMDGDGTFIAFDDVVTKGGVGSISGQVYDDLNGDGRQQSDEGGLAGRTVFVDGNGNGTRDRGEAFAITDANGKYTIDGVVFGTHRVMQQLDDGYVSTAPYTSTYDNYQAFETNGNFVDITRSGQEVEYFNKFEGSTEIQFSTPISVLNHSYNSLYASINGFLSVSSFIGLNPEPVPGRGQNPDGMIAPFWADMSIGKGGGVYFLDDQANSRIIVEWSNMKYGSSSQTFEAIIGYDGSVKFEYQTIGSTKGDVAIGIEDENGVLGAGYDPKAIQSGDGLVFTADETRHPGPAIVSVDSRGSATNVDLGAHDVSATTGSVSGVAFVDANGNGAFDAGDQVKSGWTVFVDDNGDGIRQADEAVTTTAKDGSYHFTALAPGSHQIEMFAPLSWQHWQFAGQSDSAAPVHAGTPLDHLRAAVAAGREQTIALDHHYTAADFSRAHVDGQLVVKLDMASVGLAGAPLTAATQAAYEAAAEHLATALGATRVASTQALGIELWEFHGGSLEDAAAKLMASGQFAYAQPNYLYSADSVSDAAAAGGVSTNDPLGSEVYGLDHINAPQAWQYTTGDHSVVVGCVDTGIDLEHPDLVANLWTNTGEIAGNGVDDDGNGYVDDVHGYDFADEDGNPDDDNGHGTHTAGTIGAVGDNGIGLSGVDQSVQLMALKFLDATGSGSSFNAARAIEYATMMGADVTNNSYGGGDFDNVLYDAVAAGPLFVAAAGNDAGDNDRLPHWPGNFDLPNVISVAATDQFHHLSGFSNYGATTVDLAAPGSNVLSTLPVEKGSYGYLSGTSMATPYVAGAVALLKALDPHLSDAEIKAAILGGTSIQADLVGKTVTGGELDLLGAINAITHQTQSVTVSAASTTTLNFAVTGGATDGNDKIVGYGVNETIAGGKGTDTIDAGGGNDTVIGGSDDDTLTGGAGRDIFVFADNSGRDLILDFDQQQSDQINIRNRGITSFDQLIITGDGADGSVVSAGTSVIDIAHVAPGALGEDDFTFGAPRSGQLLFQQMLHTGHDLHLALV